MMSNNQDIIKALHWRYAVKKFDASKKLTNEQLQRLMEGLQLTPTSMGLQLMKFIVIKNPELKAQIKPIAFNQLQVEQCSHLFVLCRKNTVTESDISSFVDHTAATRDIETDSPTMVGFEKMLSSSLDLPEKQQKAWMENQVYIALGNFLTLCAAEGIDACPMEGFDRPKLDELLGLENDGLNAVVMCPVGFRSSEDKYSEVKKVRRPLNNLIEER